MKQILKKEAKVFKTNEGKSARAEVNSVELKKYARKRVLIKVYELDNQPKKKRK